MAYKRYVKRGGKLCGPYYYESYRDKYGIVKKRYVGTEDPDVKKHVVPTSAISKNNIKKSFKYFNILLIIGVILLVLILTFV